MEREKFVKLVEEALDTLPATFRKRINNVAVLVEDLPPDRLPRRGSRNAGTVGSDDADTIVRVSRNSPVRIRVFVPAERASAKERPAGRFAGDCSATETHATPGRAYLPKDVLWPDI